MIAALFFSGFLSYVNERLPITESWKLKFDKLENSYNENVEAILGLNSWKDFILGLFIMAFIPAFCEEALFRGGLQNFLTRSTRMPWLSIIIVSLLFSAAHISYYGFLSRLFLGIMLGLLYQYSGRLWLSILAHFLNNALAITVLYVYKLQGKPLKDVIKDNPSTYWGVLALPVLIGLLILFKKYSRSREIQLAAAPPPFEEKQEPPPNGF